MDQPGMSRAGPDSRPSPAMRVIDVRKRFASTQALNGVSFDLARGSVHALLGGNGSGKSTLIKILAGVHRGDEGRLELPDGQALDLRAMTSAQARSAGLHFVHQQSSTFPDLTIAENLAVGRGFDTAPGYRIRWRQTRRRAEEVLERFHVNARPETLLGEVGPATQTMVAIARALQDQEGAQEGVLFLDEPTAALPNAEAVLLHEALRRYAEAGQTIVYVTHRLDEVFAVADRATLLRDGELVDTVSPSELSHDDLVELILGRSVEQIERLRTESTGSAILEVTGLSAGPLEPLDLTVCVGEVVGVAGLIGSGRSSLLRSLFGAMPLRSGRIRVNGRQVSPSTPRDAMTAGLAYIPEDRSDAAFPQLTVEENLSIAALDRYWRAGVVNSRAARRDANQLLRSYAIKADRVETSFAELSGGNQQKAILARWCRRNPAVLLLDEPTQGVDVGARAEIYTLVRGAVAKGAAALVASSDFEELAALCDRVIVLRRGHNVGELAGDELSGQHLERLAHSAAGVAA